MQFAPNGARSLGPLVLLIVLGTLVAAAPCGAEPSAPSASPPTVMTSSGIPSTDDVVDRAKELARAGNMLGAMRLLEPAAAEAGLAGELRGRRLGVLGRLRAAANDVAGAQKAMEDALQACPRQPEATALQAGFFARSGRLADALTVLQESDQSYPGSPEVLMALAQLQANAGRWDEAVAALGRAKALSLRPAERVEVLVASGQVARHQKRWTDAAGDFAEAARLGPNAAILEALLDCQKNAGQSAKALDTLRELEAALGARADEAAVRPKLEDLRKELQLAVDESTNPLPGLVEKLRRAPGSPAAERALAEASGKLLDEPERQELVVTRQSTSGRSEPPAWVKEGEAKVVASGARARFSEARGRSVVEALKQLEAWLKVFPTFDGYVGRAEMRAAQGAFGAAAQDWLVAASLLDAGHAETHDALGASGAQARELRETARLFRRLTTGAQSGLDAKVAAAHQALGKGLLLAALDLAWDLRGAGGLGGYPARLVTLVDERPGRPAAAAVAKAGLEALERRDKAAAERRSEQLLRLQVPDGAREAVAHFRVRLAESEGRGDAALNQCREALLLSPRSVPLWSWLAARRLAEGDKPEALMMFNAAAGGRLLATLTGASRAAAEQRDKLVPATAGANLKAWIVERLNRGTWPTWQVGAMEAGSTWLILLGAVSAENHVARAEERLIMRDFAGAEADVAEARRLKADAKVAQVEGELLANRKQWSAAAGAFARAATLFPRLAGKYHRRRGECLLEAGQVKEALGAFTAAVAAAPDNADSQAGLGDCYARLKRLDEAIGAYDKAIAASGSNAWMAYAYGLVRTKLVAERDEAARTVKRAGP